MSIPILVVLADQTTLLMVFFLVLSATRVYVLWNRSRLLFAFLIVLGAFRAVYDLYILIKTAVYNHSPYPTHSCLLYGYLPSLNHIRPGTGTILLTTKPFRYALYSSTHLLFEIFALVLTWAKTYPALHLLRSSGMSVAKSLFYIICRDGTLQFSVVVALSVIGLISRFWQPLAYIMILSDTLISIAISRFIFNLREHYVDRVIGEREDRSLHVSDMSSIRFDPQVIRRGMERSNSAERT
ncbi:hypothetical protein BDY19DRAFT_998719 [Irpex rosettiformis]|uniref:Uncharacterized protein n=1 Tax=Irpex rosettiformis TaxID=378272 RepID=A0ACB8TMJ6_9APHY|nr:hypothetical protein BDY19DRAFT_998719 [Irpex rosettiformis]